MSPQLTIHNAGGAELEQPLLHVAGEKIWLDWKDSDTTFGWSERQGQQWTQPSLLPWTDFTWVGIEAARVVTEGEVLGP
jgi:hypothetical protein